MSDTRFKKGNVPWNKGKITNLVPPNVFKKGHVVWHTRELFSERISKDGYIYIKVSSPRKWLPKHKWIWEEENGSVPKNHVIIFADGNKRNFSIDNLICVSRKELLILNRDKLIKTNTEQTKTGVAIAKLKAKLYDLRKERSNGNKS